MNDDKAMKKGPPGLSLEDIGKALIGISGLIEETVIKNIDGSTTHTEYTRPRYSNKYGKGIYTYIEVMHLLTEIIDSIKTDMKVFQEKQLDIKGHISSLISIEQVLMKNNIIWENKEEKNEKEMA